MIATNYSGLRANMKSYLDRVVDESETLVVTRKQDANVIVMSEDTYNNLLENMHLLGTEANRKWLLESKAQLEAGKASVRTLDRA